MESMKGQIHEKHLQSTEHVRAEKLLSRKAGRQKRQTEELKANKLIISSMFRKCQQNNTKKAPQNRKEEAYRMSVFRFLNL